MYLQVFVSTYIYIYIYISPGSWYLENKDNILLLQVPKRINTVLLSRGLKNRDNILGFKGPKALRKKSLKIKSLKE